MNNREAQLLDRIAELEELLGLRMPKPSAGLMLGMPKKSRQIIGLLMKRPLGTKEYIWAALYGDKPEADQPTCSQIIAQHVCRTNRVLKQYGIVIKTEYSIGYYLDKDDKKRLTALLEEMECGTGPQRQVHLQSLSSQGVVPDQVS